jgi:cell division protein FtsL
MIEQFETDEENENLDKKTKKRNIKQKGLTKNVIIFLILLVIIMIILLFLFIYKKKNIYKITKLLHCLSG